ncbi:MAG: radical SAM family heme chaperone HemW [Bacillota bacterium]|nr:radical SAM family heme chaperone HemW [Bacillota bacterium]
MNAAGQGTELLAAPALVPAWGLYVHIPFCHHRCTYCDFVLRPLRPGLVERFLGALEREAAELAPLVAGRAAASLYVGGGTPSVLRPDQIERLFGLLRRHFTWQPDAEVTVEANPESLDEERLEAFARQGVNRLSLGVQAWQPEILRRLGRRHGAAEVRRAVELARRAGLDRLNADLMFGLPGQDRAAWEESLEAAIELGFPHLSAYALELEPGTAFGRLHAAGRLALPDDEEVADMYDLARHRLAEAGYEQVEISNWARPGFASRHNLLYWRTEEWLGLGPGAASRLGGLEWTDTGDVEGWMAAVEAGGPPPRRIGQLDPLRAASDAVILGLRLRRGVDLDAFRRRFGLPLEEAFPGALERALSTGLAELRRGRLRLTEEGCFLANRVMEEFLPPAS